MVKKKTTVPKVPTTHAKGQQEKPPVVVVLGHVDHGKTTLLDSLRKTDVATREHGGITQKIGAYQITVDTLEGKKKITFIDTPGHEAFAKMRGRGVGACDIALLVVASDDGVAPQTKESIAHIKAAHIPFIVVLTKSDSPGAAPEQVKQQLLAQEVKLEGFGGDVPAVLVSAKTGKGLSDLLDVILLLSQIKGIKANPQGPFEGVVIEARRDRQKGTLATIIVQNGTLAIGDDIVAEGKSGKVKALLSDNGEMLKVAVPGAPVEILGFSDVPEVGAKVVKKNQTGGIREAVSTQVKKDIALPQADRPTRLLPLIIKADTQGSLETIRALLLGEDVKIILAATGDLSESDVLLARASSAILIGFNVKTSPSVLKLAENEGIIVKTYKLIYELEEEIKEVVALFRQGKAQEVVLGKAKILAVFPYDNKKVAGCKILEGRIAKGDKVRVTREETVVGEARVVSIRQGKEETNKTQAPSECGILLSAALDFAPSDVILSVR